MTTAGGGVVSESCGAPAGAVKSVIRVGCKGPRLVNENATTCYLKMLASSEKKRILSTKDRGRNGILIDEPRTSKKTLSRLRDA